VLTAKFEMNPYDGYQLYQVQRAKTRAEILAEDARRGVEVRHHQDLGGLLCGTSRCSVPDR
jgi:hypothetical protein